MQRSGGRQIERRGKVWSAIAMALFALLAARLFSIQVLQHEHFARLAEECQGRTWSLPAPRGYIYDRNGTPLALNIEVFSVAADPETMFHSKGPAGAGSPRSPEEAAAKLAPLLHMPQEELARKLTPKGGDRHVLLCDSVDEQVAKAIRALDIRGIIVRKEWRRAYPHGSLAAALTGFVGKDGNGLAGVEAARNRELAGKAGRMFVVLDGRLPRSRGLIPGRSVITKEMMPGESVSLTIDINIQAIAEEELAKAVKAARAKGGTAIVMDPKTGEILALATQPGFDPNQFAHYPRETWVNRAISNPYEPGSTFKVITACAAIEEGVMSHGETYDCKGELQVGGRTISCAMHGGKRAHGVVDLDEMVVESCNGGMATVGLALGADRLYKWIRRFGFGEKTGIELGGESPGLVSRPETWARIQLATIAFGQGISVTPVQLIAAYCAIANGGLRVHPHVIRDPQKARPGGRIISSATAARMRRVLERVVTEGTGKRAAIPGRRVAGKTGTAQKPMPGVGFRSGLYVASFAGFAPVSDPRIAVLVVIDEPKAAHYGGVVAAPAFSAICERTLAYLRVPPDAAPEPPVEQAKQGGPLVSEGRGSG